ncbi:hypothetical protein FRB96_000268 [Tulasnella sp. 330]|nr:hypothetical protein FRB96_000268 [Tulasnella sp. 330]KAG8886541.1 hypothetical protein FRB97_003052 [Tulasnella sp. 331]KAG8889798.1 hypothetical protein FRB98_002720 [Tulasnella sp. 332]
MDEPAPTAKPKGIDRDKTCPFLLRTFVKVNGYHPISLFENQKLPVTDEHQIYTWQDATLRELVTYLRSLPPSSLTLSLRHPAARYSFRVVFADATSYGRMTTKDLGSVHAKDIIHLSQLSSSLEEGSTMDVDNDKPSTVHDIGGSSNDHSRNLEELRVQPGDYLLVAIYLPVKTMGVSIAGAAGASSLASPIGLGSTPSSARGGGFGRVRLCEVAGMLVGDVVVAVPLEVERSRPSVDIGEGGVRLLSLEGWGGGGNGEPTENEIRSPVDLPLLAEIEIADRLLQGEIEIDDARSVGAVRGRGRDPDHLCYDGDRGQDLVLVLDHHLAVEGTERDGADG